MKVRVVPINSVIKLKKFDGKALSKYIVTYASLIGGLNWAVFAVRVDIGFAMIKLLRYLSNPGP